MAYPPVVDLTPAVWLLQAYQGDPFPLRVTVTVGGAPADLSGWTWQAWIDAGGGVVIPWLWEPETDGVSLYLRGADTARLPATYSSYDVTGRDPDAGEGYTVLRGGIIALDRVTPPLRGSAQPGPVALAVSA